MELHRILTVKQARFEALIRVIRLYMEQDECVCDGRADLPLLRLADHSCPPECEECTWCIGRTALRGVGQTVDAQ